MVVAFPQIDARIVERGDDCRHIGLVHRVGEKGAVPADQGDADRQGVQHGGKPALALAQVGGAFGYAVLEIGVRRPQGFKRTPVLAGQGRDHPGRERQNRKQKL